MSKEILFGAEARKKLQSGDPWFVPWTPNASASGRLILMLLKLQKESDNVN